MSEWSYIYLTRSWQIQADPTTLFDPARPDQKWELYASLKFTGAGYPHGVEGEPEGVWVDRLFLVRVEK
jgi:hypothetical protein